MEANCDVLLTGFIKVNYFVWIISLIAKPSSAKVLMMEVEGDNNLKQSSMSLGADSIAPPPHLDYVRSDRTHRERYWQSDNRYKDRYDYRQSRGPRYGRDRDRYDNRGRDVYYGRSSDKTPDERRQREQPRIRGNARLPGWIDETVRFPCE